MHEIFQYENDELEVDGLALSDVVKEQPTPFYVYAPGGLVARYRELEAAFGEARHFHAVALKANAQPALLRPLVAAGAGAEVVSGAELGLALALGFEPSKIVFSGVGKTEPELRSGVRAGIALLLVESRQELALLNAVAESEGRRASVALRLNPDIDAKTHPHIATGVKTAKFGIDPEEAETLYKSHRDFPSLELVGVHSHIGSQITEIEPLAANARTLAAWVRSLRPHGVELRYVDVGGGLGIRYREEETPSFRAYAEQVVPPIAELGATVITEPGRVLFGPVGAFVVRVLYVKRVHGRDFVVVDAGLNDLLRPALYGAYHGVVPLTRRRGEARSFDVAGAVCESSDVFARDRALVAPQPGDALAILDTGAYGFVMSSNYNLRPRPAELVVENGTFRVVRRAETQEELVARELGT